MSAKRERKTQKAQRRSPSQSRSRATVDAILEATARIIRNEGIAAANTNRIAARAGISIGSLYGYFPDKNAIFVEIARGILKQDQQALQSVLKREPDNMIVELIGTLLHRHRTDRRVRRDVMSAHISAGHASEHHRNVEMFLEKLMKQAGLVEIEPLQLFVASQAVLGIARSLSEEDYQDIPEPWLETIQAETVALVRNFLQF